MKILINCSDLRGTGVCQVAVSFLNECCYFSENEYVVFVADPVSLNIDIESFPSNFKFYKFDETPLCSLKGWPKILKMKKIEAIEKPDITFSVFGPSYWRPKSPHLMGYAYPHYIYKDSPIFEIMSWKERLNIQIRQWLHVSQLKMNGDYYVCETEDTKLRWCKIFSIPQDHVWMVYNTASKTFLEYAPTQVSRHDNEFRFFTLCSPYRHKNLEILNEVCLLMSKLDLNKNIKFYTTLPKESVNKIFNEQTRRYVENIGPLKVAECPKLVDECDALFLPTLLECYSASYPEAMIMGKPILTSFLPFAKTVCEDAALYFDPMNADDVLEKILKIVDNPSIYKELQNRGKERVKIFGTARDRAKMYLSICKEIVSMEQEKCKK